MNKNEKAADEIYNHVRDVIGEDSNLLTRSLFDLPNPIVSNTNKPISLGNNKGPYAHQLETTINSYLAANPTWDYTTALRYVSANYVDLYKNYVKEVTNKIG